MFLNGSVEQHFSTYGDYIKFAGNCVNKSTCFLGHNWSTAGIKIIDIHNYDYCQITEFYEPVVFHEKTIFTMIYFLKYDIPSICKKIIHDQLRESGLNYHMTSHTEIEISDLITEEHLKFLNHSFKEQGVEIIETQKSILIQKIKEAIIELVNMEEKLSTVKTSEYLASKLHHRYGYLSNIFSEVTYTTIENFMILQKIEKAKQLITTNELTFTEIAWKLNYSSMAHFSLQFKNTTGLTPSAFQRIINKRRMLTPAA